MVPDPAYKVGVMCPWIGIRDKSPLVPVHSNGPANDLQKQHARRRRRWCNSGAVLPQPLTGYGLTGVGQSGWLTGWRTGWLPLASIIVIGQVNYVKSKRRRLQSGIGKILKIIELFTRPQSLKYFTHKTNN